MGTFINSFGSFINQYINKCWKFAKVAKIVSVRVTTKVKISIFGDVQFSDDYHICPTP